MRHLYKLLIIAVASLIFLSCAELDNNSLNFIPERPEEVAMSEFINQYDALNAYIDRDANPHFKLGMGMNVSDFLKKETLFSLALSNFDEISSKNSVNHGNTVANDGSLDFTTFSTYIEAATKEETTLFGHALGWHANQNGIYLNELIAPIIIPSDDSEGSTVIADFESDNIGKTYAMTGNGTATVVADPAGQSGNVLHIGGPASYSYPKFEIVLPAGRKLGDYKTLTMDFNGTGSTGLYGSGMRMAINNIDAQVTYNSPSGYGCPDGAWGRGRIVMEFESLNLSPAQRELTSFTLMVGSGTGSGDYYIDNVTMDWESSGGTSVGATSVVDFDTDDVENTYDMTNGGSATVLADPTGADNKALNVISNQSHPIFSVALPERITLGDCKRITLKFYGSGSTGRYGQGMRLSINGSSLFNFPSPADNGVQDNQWGGINLDLSTISLSVAQKELNEFTIAVGSATGSGNYFIDDVVIHWEKNNIIERTPAEKEELISEALETWIAGVMEINDGFIKAWDVINEPMSDDDNFMLRSEDTDPNPNDNFYWQDYLGANYAMYAVNYARQYFKEYGGNESELKLFVNDYGLEKSGSRKCERLIEMIQQWESEDIIIDGIGTQMNLIYSLDPTLQEQYEEGILSMFRKLSDTNKLIRISGLTIKLQDQNGAVIETSDLTFTQQQSISDYYNFIIKKYFEIIPSEQRYGISITNPVDSSDSIGLWNSTYNRRYTYTGFADGLAGE